MKIDMCKSIGYKLIYIWEHDWNSKKEYIKNRLLDIFK
jgi:hypothetical protein